MKAFVLNELYKYPELQSTTFPTLGDDEVYIKINASSINHRDLWIVKGMYPGIILNTILGSDACGVSGENTFVINPGLFWGDNPHCQSSAFQVLGMPSPGTFAEHIAINQKYLYACPAHLTEIEAAAIPLAGVTAYRALFKRALVKKEDKVLISGIGGGVALFAMQFAIAAGCEVIVTSSSDYKIAEAIDLGAHAGYLYTNPDWYKELIHDFGGVDVIIDGACGQGFNNLVKTCNPGARISFYGGSVGKIDGLNPQTIFWKQITIAGSTMGSDQDFAEMIDFISEHQIKPVIDSIFPFDQITEGFKRMESSLQFGKIVFQH